MSSTANSNHLEFFGVLFFVHALRPALTCPGGLPKKSSQLTHSFRRRYRAAGSRGISTGRFPEDAQRLYAEDVVGASIVCVSVSNVASVTSVQFAPSAPPPEETPPPFPGGFRSVRMYVFASLYPRKLHTRCGFPGGFFTPRKSSHPTQVPRTS
jgi:hypothetical protein